MTDVINSGSDLSKGLIDISNIKIQLSNLTDASLNEISYNSYSDFFKNFLEKYNLSIEQYNNMKPENEEEKQKKINIYYDSLKNYKEKSPWDYYVELEKQKRKYKKEQEEYKKNKQEYEKIKKEEIIKMVIRQTNYSYEVSKEKLEQNDYNYLKVIKMYLSDEYEDNNEENKKQDNIKSTNQEIYNQIREFMSKSKIR